MIEQAIYLINLLTAILKNLKFEIACHLFAILMRVLNLSFFNFVKYT